MANSIVAQLNNQADYEQADAAEALDPGQGVEVDANGDFAAAAADSKTTRVVREQRNPPRNASGTTSPLNASYSAGDHCEAVGFQRYDQARVLVENNGTASVTITEGDKLGWNASGYLDTSHSETVAVARDPDGVSIAAGATEHVLVEFF